VISARIFGPSEFNISKREKAQMSCLQSKANDIRILEAKNELQENKYNTAVKYTTGSQGARNCHEVARYR